MENTAWSCYCDNFFLFTNLFQEIAGVCLSQNMQSLHQHRNFGAPNKIVLSNLALPYRLFGAPWYICLPPGTFYCQTHLIYNFGDRSRSFLFKGMALRILSARIFQWLIRSPLVLTICVWIQRLFAFCSIQLIL